MKRITRQQSMLYTESFITGTQRTDLIVLLYMVILFLCTAAPPTNIRATILHFLNIDGLCFATCQNHTTLKVETHLLNICKLVYIHRDIFHLSGYISDTLCVAMHFHFSLVIFVELKTT